MHVLEVVSWKLVHTKRLQRYSSSFYYLNLSLGASTFKIQNRKSHSGNDKLNSNKMLLPSNVTKCSYDAI